MEDIKEDALMEQVQPPCMEYCELEDKEVYFPLCEEDDYPSLCIIRNIDDLKNDEGKDELITMLCDESWVVGDHLSKHDIIENYISSHHLITRNRNVGSDQDGGFGYVVIEDFLESFKKGNV